MKTRVYSVNIAGSINRSRQVQAISNDDSSEKPSERVKRMQCVKKATKQSVSFIQ